MMAHQDVLDDEGHEDATDVSKAQDFHSMLEVVLRSYIALQGTGFFWDLHYKLGSTKRLSLYCSHLLLGLMARKLTNYVENI